MGRSQEVLSVRDRDQFWRVQSPVDPVDNNGGVGCDFFAEGRDVPLWKFVVFFGIETTAFLPFQMMSSSHLAGVDFVHI